MNATKYPAAGIAGWAWSAALDEHKDDDPGSDRVGLTYVCNAILIGFNPPDGDDAYEAILADAVERAALFIEAQPCTCPPDPFEDGACDRCTAIGRAADEPQT